MGTLEILFHFYQVPKLRCSGHDQGWAEPLQKEDEIILKLTGPGSCFESSPGEGTGFGSAESLPVVKPFLQRNALGAARLSGIPAGVSILLFLAVFSLTREQHIFDSSTGEGIKPL